MNGSPPNSVVFFRNENGREPVREWLKTLDRDDRKKIGEDIKVVQFRWPLGMPANELKTGRVRKDLWQQGWQ